jgi:hypothetical protein
MTKVIGAFRYFATSHHKYSVFSWKFQFLLNKISHNQHYNISKIKCLFSFWNALKISNYRIRFTRLIMWEPQQKLNKLGEFLCTLKENWNSQFCQFTLVAVLRNYCLPWNVQINCRFCKKTVTHVIGNVGNQYPTSFLKFHFYSSSPILRLTFRIGLLIRM